MKLWAQSNPERKGTQNHDGSATQWVVGLIAVTAVTLASLWLGGQLPQLGGAIIAMLIGLLLRNLFSLGADFTAVTGFITKRVLKIAIILLGATFTLGEAASLGLGYYPIVLITIFVALVSAVFAGKVLRVPWRLSALVGAGTAICGATAIIALSPVIRAKREETAYAIATIFLFNLAAMILFPFVGHYLGLSQQTFGAWAGAAVHDTSSVMATGFAYGDSAGETAVVVKLGRTLMLIPLLLLASIVMSRQKESTTVSQGRWHVVAAIPWFIIAFLAMTALSSVGVIQPGVAQSLGRIGKLLTVGVLAAVGLGTELSGLRRLGGRAISTAFVASLLAATLSLWALRS